MSTAFDPSDLTPAMRSVLDRMARAGRPALHTLTPAQAKAAYEAGAGVLEVPVVVSTDGGLRELLRGDNGLLCDPYDIPAWIAATRRILDNPLFGRSLAANGRITVSELTPERHASRVAAIYRGIHAPAEKVA